MSVGSRYRCVLLAFGLGPVLRPGLLAVLDALAVELAADDVVADAGEVADAAAADEHDRVFLQVVAFAADVRRYFHPGRQSDPGHLAQRRVRLLRGHRLDHRADAPLLRAPLNGRVLRLGPLRLAGPADQLVHRRHRYPPSAIGQSIQWTAPPGRKGGHAFSPVPAGERG